MGPPPDPLLWMAVLWVLVGLTGYVLLYGPRLVLTFIDWVTP